MIKQIQNEGNPEVEIESVGSSEDKRVSNLPSASLCDNCDKPPLIKGGGLLAVVGLKRGNSLPVKNLLTYLPTNLLTKKKAAFILAEVFSPHSDGHHRIAFTLAEVLITLGIIGVVAAMTMPTIINSTQDKILETQYKKAKTILANGYKLMMAKTSSFKVENLPFLASCEDGAGLQKCISKEHKAAFNIVSDSAGTLTANTLPAEYIILGESEKSPFKWSDVEYIFSTGDGIVYGVIPDDGFTSFSVVVDVNGKKNPNTVMKDLYKFRYGAEGRLFDVSDELEVVEVCSWDNLDACKTPEACYTINGCWYGASSSGQCWLCGPPEEE